MQGGVYVPRTPTTGVLYMAARYPDAPPWPTDEYRSAAAKTRKVRGTSSVIERDACTPVRTRRQRHDAASSLRLIAASNVVTETNMVKSNVAGAQALKKRLGAYLRKVRQGATIVVTDRGEPVAELRPFSRPRGGTHPGLARLLASGAVTRETNAPLVRFRPVRSKGRPLSEAVVRDREDRF